MDNRWSLLANQLIRGLDITSNTKVSMFMNDFRCMEAVSAFVAECYKVGALPQVLATDERFDRFAQEFASDETLKSPAGLEVIAMEWADVHVSFRGMVAPDFDVDQRKVALQRKGKGIVSTKRWQQTRWCIVRIPAIEWSKMINVDHEELLHEFFDSSIADWEKIGDLQSSLCDRLAEASQIRILSSDSDLVLGVAGRRWLSFAGEMNLPDGEVATAPIETSVNGHIKFPGVFWFSGIAIRDLILHFEGGKVVFFSATEGADLVAAVLETDDGSRHLGEIGIGTNPNMKTLTGDLLLDEKILGTVHIALGRAYPDSLGINESALHWDIVKDLREQGCFLYADDLELISNGKLRVPLANFSSLRK